MRTAAVIAAVIAAAAAAASATGFTVIADLLPEGRVVLLLKEGADQLPVPLIALRSAKQEGDDCACAGKDECVRGDGRGGVQSGQRGEHGGPVLQRAQQRVGVAGWLAGEELRGCLAERRIHNGVDVVSEGAACVAGRGIALLTAFERAILPVDRDSLAACYHPSSSPSSTQRLHEPVAGGPQVLHRRAHEVPHHEHPVPHLAVRPHHLREVGEAGQTGEPHARLLLHRHPAVLVEQLQPPLLPALAPAHARPPREAAHGAGREAQAPPAPHHRRAQTVLPDHCLGLPLRLAHAQRPVPAVHVAHHQWRVVVPLRVLLGGEHRVGAQAGARAGEVPREAEVVARARVLVHVHGAEVDRDGGGQERDDERAVEERGKDEVAVKAAEAIMELKGKGSEGGEGADRDLLTECNSVFIDARVARNTV